MLNLLFFMRGEIVGVLGGRMGFSRGSVLFICLSFFSFICFIYLVFVGFFLVCKARVVVVVEMVEFMIGVSSMILRFFILFVSVRGSSSLLLE